MPKELHPVQKRLLELLAKHQDDPLTVREIQEKLGLSSPGHVAYHIQQIEKKGLLHRNPDDPRDYTVQQSSPTKNLIWINQYGLARCGPKGTILSNPIDRIPIPTRLITFPSAEAFLVQAKGDSMAPKIVEGDIVICQKSVEVPDGTVAVCVNEGEAIIKKVRKEKTHRRVTLISLNEAYDPFFASDDFRIVGQVKGVISTNMKS
jgi:repressor LexA